MAIEQKLLVGCDRCARIQHKEFTDGTVYFWFPLGHTLSKVTTALADQRIDASVDRDDGVVRVDLGVAPVDRLISTMEPLLSSREQDDTRVLHMPDGGRPALSDVARVMSLTEFAEVSRADKLRWVLTEERLTSHYQPIVSVDEPTHIYAQEALLRGIDDDGSHISPAGLFRQARASGLLFQLDLAARRSAILNADRHNMSSKLFVNFSPAAIYDPVYCLRTTVGAVRQSGLARDQVVFEVIESDKADDPEHLLRILDHYRAAGFKVALDDIGAGYGSLNLLSQLRPDYIKLDMQLIRGVHEDPYKAMIASKLLEMANALGVKSIVEGVETRDELHWARENGADFAQGYFIARPAASPKLSL
jgi:EAL domain-containing protein (putative c-di-GMP-specific phosphodiesterase class I)